MRVIIIEGESLEAVRARLRGHEDSEHVIVDEEVLSGLPEACEAPGPTIEAALATARPKDPDVSIDKEEIITHPAREVLKIEAFDAEEARRSASPQPPMFIESITIDRRGSSGFFGLGRRPHVFAVALTCSARVRVCYHRPCKIQVTLATKDDKARIDSDAIPSESHQNEVHRLATAVLSPLDWDDSDGEWISEDDALNRFDEDPLLGLEVLDEALVLYKNDQGPWRCEPNEAMMLDILWQQHYRQVVRLRGGRERQTTTPTLRHSGLRRRG
jgi:hypothetical protein